MGLSIGMTTFDAPKKNHEMALQDKIDQALKTAMLAKDNSRLRGLRAIKAAILLARTEKGPAEALTETMEISVLQKLAKQRLESAEIYQQQNRDDLYTIEMEELAVIEEFLPKQLSEGGGRNREAGHR